jgi:prevent-host-death family protein
MQVAVSEAKGLLLDLVRKAESGEEIILTRHGNAIARIVGVAPGAAERRAALEEARGAALAIAGAPAARSPDCLYDEAGLPA